MAQLEAASGLADEFVLFRTRDLRGFPAPLQPALAIAAQGRLRDNLLARVAAAQTTAGAGEGSLRAQIRSLISAAPLLTNISRALAEDGAAADAAALSDSVTRLAQVLLVRVDAALEDGQFFAVPRGRTVLWDGGRLDVPTLFGEPSLGALGDALQDQRQQVASLANDMARPLLALIAAQPARGRSAVVDKWTRLAAELNRAADGRTDTSASRLFAFIRADLPDLDLSNCRPAVAKAMAGAGSDWFSTRLTAIARQVAASCDGVLTQQASTGYGLVVAAFNRLLAGRYPFADAGARLDRPVSVAALADFFRVFDEQAPSVLAAYQARGTMDEASRRAAQFMAQMARVRAFLAPLVPGPDNAAPALKLDVTFRANAGAEQGGREVVDWQFFAGLDRATNFAAQAGELAAGRPRGDATALGQGRLREAAGSTRRRHGGRGRPQRFRSLHRSLGTAGDVAAAGCGRWQRGHAADVRRTGRPDPAGRR